MVVEDHLGPSGNPLEYQLEHLPERLLECLLGCLLERLLEHYQDPKYYIRKMMDMNFFITNQHWYSLNSRWDRSGLLPYWLR